jgi:hypothetical protein
MRRATPMTRSGDVTGAQNAMRRIGRHLRSGCRGEPTAGGCHSRSAARGRMEITPSRHLPVHPGRGLGRLFPHQWRMPAPARQSSR